MHKLLGYLDIKSQVPCLQRQQLYSAVGRPELEKISHIILKT